jgi:hypothetical protein
MFQKICELHFNADFINPTSTTEIDIVAKIGYTLQDESPEQIEKNKLGNL